MAEMASVGGFASSNWAVGCQYEIRRAIDIAYLRTDMSEVSKEQEGLYTNLCREYGSRTKYPSPNQKLSVPSEHSADQERST